MVSIEADNGTSHGAADNLEWECMLVDPREWVMIEVVDQAVNSLDTNINDLGLFHAMQSNYWAQAPATTVDELIVNILKAFTE